MVYILKNNKENGKILLKCAPMMVTSIILSVGLIYLIRFKLELDIINNIEEINHQVSNSMQYKLESQLSQLKNIAKKIEDEDNEIKRNILIKNIHEFNESTLFDAIHTINKDGYTMCGESVYLGDRKYFRESLKGKYAISNSIQSRVSHVGEDAIAFSVPIEVDGEITGVLQGMYELKDLEKLLISDSYSKNNVDNKIMILLYGKNDELIVSNIKNNITNSNDNVKEILYEISKIRNLYTMNTSLLNDKSWNLITVTPKKLASENSSNVTMILTIVAILWNLLFFITKFFSAKKEYSYNENLEKIAFKDKLTGNDNFEKFILDLDSVLKKSNDKFILVCFDIDRFKFINKVFGYSLGDELIRQIDKNISTYIENTYKYARINNDIFVIAIKVIDKELAIKKIVKMLKENIILDGINENILNSNDITIDTSIGIYFIEDNSQNIRTMVDYADLARKKSKELVSDNFCIFDKKLLKEKEEIINIEKNIHTALENNQFRAYYQPKVCIRTNKIVGAEALIRWIKDDGSFVRPDKFIPIAERNGSINLIGRWILKQVCKDLNTWKKKGYNVVPVSINLSSVEFYQSDLISFIKNTLEEYDIEPQLIEIEITETTALNDIDYISKKIKSIKTLGLTVSMDDFGTGYSTLSNLQLIPLDTLKIDRSLSVDIDKNEKSRQIVKLIIDLGKVLDQKIVCEGVEDLNQVEILRSMGCDIIQGFVFYKPMNFIDIEKVIKEL